MHGAILWCGFVGAWLLVAGPVYQAALELDAEEVARDALENAANQLPPSARPLAWIAVKETWELVEFNEWPSWLFWVLIVLMAAAAALNTTVRMVHTHRLVDQGIPRS